MVCEISRNEDYLVDRFHKENNKASKRFKIALTKLSTNHQHIDKQLNEIEKSVRSAFKRARSDQILPSFSRLNTSQIKKANKEDNINKSGSARHRQRNKPWQFFIHFIQTGFQTLNPIKAEQYQQW